MKINESDRAFLRVVLGWALSLAFLLLFLKGLIPAWLLAVVLVPGLGIYVRGGVDFAKANGCSAARTLLLLVLGLWLSPLALLLRLDKGRFSVVKLRPAGRQRRGSATTVATWLPGLFFVTIGAGIGVAYEIYRARVLVPEREGLATAISVATDKADPQNDGKLVHVVGTLGGVERLTDPMFGVAVDALKLRRRVWLYQWEQGGVRSESLYGEEDSHGKTTTLLKTRTYDYSMVWSEKPIDSSAFYNAGHDNPPTKIVPDCAMAAAKISLGAFAVSPELAEQIDDFHTVPMTATNLSALPAGLRTQAKAEGEGVYFGATPQKPTIGDLKVRVEFAPSATASIIAKQNGASLSPCRLARGGSIALLKIGSYSVQEMIKQFAQDTSRERMLVWGMGGFVILFGLGIARASAIRARTR